MKIPLFEIMQIAALIPQVITEVERLIKAKPGKIKQAEARKMILAVPSIADAFSKFDVTNKKLAEKGINKMIDGAVDFMNATTWE